MEYGADVTPEQLVAAVESAGYQAELQQHSPADDGTVDDDPTAALRRRLLISLALSVPVIAMAMVPGAAVPLLAVVVADAGGTGRGLGRLAVPRRGAGRNLRHAPRRWTR